MNSPTRATGWFDVLDKLIQSDEGDVRMTSWPIGSFVAVLIGQKTE